MKYQLFLSCLFIFLVEPALSSGEGGGKASAGLASLPVSVFLGFNSPAIPGHAREQTCGLRVVHSIQSIKQAQKDARTKGETKQCYIKAMLYSFNDQIIINELRAAIREGVNVELMLDREQLAKSVTAPYNEDRNRFLKEVSLTIIGTPYESGANKRVLHQKSALFYCVDESGLTQSSIMLGSYNWTYGAAHYNFENCVSIENPGTLFDALHGQFEKLNNIDSGAVSSADQVDPEVRKYPAGIDFTSDPAIAAVIGKAASASAEDSNKRPRAESSSGKGGGGSGVDFSVMEEDDWIDLTKWSTKPKGDGVSYSRDFSGSLVTVFVGYDRKWKYVYNGRYGPNFDSAQEAMRQSYADLVNPRK